MNIYFLFIKNLSSFCNLFFYALVEQKNMSLLFLTYEQQGFMFIYTHYCILVKRSLIVDKSSSMNQKINCYNF